MYKLSELLAESVLLFDKPIGWTSFDLVKKIRGVLRNASGCKKIKIGHAGTLDPLADGLLIVCTGKKTKTIDQIQAQEKEYTGIFCVGATTPSFDLESEIDQEYPYEHINRELIEPVLPNFTGILQQIPPQFSAVKVKGKRAYDYARQGEVVKIEPKTISIYHFSIDKIELPNLHFTVRCSKGTYIRSLARDFGKALNSGAHLAALRRTKIGSYKVEDALNPLNFEFENDLNADT